MTQRSGQHNIAGLCNGSTADSDSVCEGSNPSPAAKRSLKPKGFKPLFSFHPYFDPLPVPGFSIDSAPHIGFHAVRTVLLHLLRNMTVRILR